MLYLNHENETEEIDRTLDRIIEIAHGLDVVEAMREASDLIEYALELGVPEATLVELIAGLAHEDLDEYSVSLPA